MKRAYIRSEKRLLCRAAALALCAAVTVCGAAPAIAAPPVPTHEETLYVNLDSYGAPVDWSVVKRYMPNGAAQITDNGVYGRVTNMTSRAEPEIVGGTVRFELEDGQESFYFEGTLPDCDIVLPWSIDVSYMLNGAPSDAASLAGSRGLVDILIDVVPEKATGEYYRNNMAMLISTAVDGDDVISLSAPGAQVQSVGNLKAVVFTVLPGEEQHFTLSIGSDDFEFYGLLMMMMPVTLEQTADIADLREARDKITDSADGISDSLDVILNTMSGLTEPAKTAKSGISGVDGGLAAIEKGRGGLYADADRFAERLKGLSGSIEGADGHIAALSETVTQSHDKIGAAVAAMTSLKEDSEAMRESIRLLQNDLKGVSRMLSSVEGEWDAREDLFEDASENLSDLKKITNRLVSDIAAVRGAMSGLPVLPNVSTISEDIDGGDLDELAKRINRVIGDINDDIDSYNAISGGLTAMAGQLLANGTDEAKTLGRTVDVLDDGLDLLDNYMTDVEEHLGDARYVAEHTGDLAGEIAGISEKLDSINDTANEMYEILDAYQPELTDTLSQAQDVCRELSGTVDSAGILFDNSKALLRSAGRSLTSGSRTVLAGTEAALDSIEEGLAQTDVIKNAKDVIHSTVNDEWDRFSEEEMTILNMDPSALPPSFTSADNPNPTGIQIILRTQEITKPDDDGQEQADEDFHAEGSFFTRLISIFKQIWKVITGLFSGGRDR